MAHAQKPDFVFRRNGRVHLNRRGHQFGRLLAAEVCASVVVMLDTPCSEVVWRVLVTHSICQFPLHFPSRASPCAITFDCVLLCYKEQRIKAIFILCIWPVHSWKFFTNKETSCISFSSSTYQLFFPLTLPLYHGSTGSDVVGNSIQ
jgi:hypothetical protein